MFSVADKKNIDPKQIYDKECAPDEKLEKGKLQHKSYLLTKLKAISGISPESIKYLSEQLDRVCSVFLPHLAKADYLALKYQKYYQRGSIIIYVLAALSIVVVSAQSLFHLPHWIILIKIGFVACIIAIILSGNRIGLHRKWIDYRFLAERFRVAIFMAIVDEDAKGEFEPDNLYHPQDREHWALFYFDSIWNLWKQKTKEKPSSEAHTQALKTFMYSAWLEDQRQFHIKKSKKHERKHERLSFIGLVLFYCTFAAGIFHFILSYFHTSIFIERLLTLFTIALPAFGSAFSALRAHFVHNKLARRSKQMVYHIERLNGLLVKVNDMKGLQHIAREADRLMLNENADWHMQIGFHNLETPS